MQSSHERQREFFLAVTRGFLLKRGRSIFERHGRESWTFEEEQVQRTRRTEGRRIPVSIFPANLRDYYTIPQQLPLVEKKAESGRSALYLMVSLVLWNIGFQERQERVSVGRSRCNVTGVGGSGGRSGNGFRRIVLCEFRCEVCGEGRSLRQSRSGKVFYGTDMVICGLITKVEVSE